MKTLPGLLAAAALVAACGTDEPTDDNNNVVDITDFVGKYETKSLGRSADCTDFEDDVVPPPFFEVVEVDSQLEVHVCRSATDCDDFAEDGYVFEQDGDEWVSLAIWTFWNGGTSGNDKICSNNARERVMKIRNDGVLRIDSSTTQEALQDDSFTDEDVCEANLGDWTPRFIDEFDCERWDGTKAE